MADGYAPAARRRALIRTVAAAVLGLLAAVAIAACGSGSSSSSKSSSSGGGATTSASTSSGGTPVRGGTLTFARTADIESLDPIIALDNPSIWALENMYDTLYTVTANGQGTQPWLATGYKLSSNQLTWTFFLRHGLEFSNGKPLTAADVAFSINRARVSKAGIGYLDDEIASVSAAGPYDVIVKVKRPWAPLLADLSLFVNSVLPNHLDGESASTFFQHPVSSGPFVLSTWNKGSNLLLVRNTHYWQPGKPYLNSVNFVNAPDANSRLVQLKGGQAQIIEAPPSSSVATLNSQPGLKVGIFPSTRIDVLLPNEKYAPLADVHVRQAIAHAIDYHAIVKAVLFGYGTPANSVFPQRVPYYNADNQGATYDVAEAKADMAASHYPHGFSMSFLADSDYSEVAQIVQQELAPLGIKVSIQTVPSTDLFTEQQKFAYQMSVDFWTMDIPDPDEYAEYALNYSAGSFSFFTNYNNPQMSKLVETAARTLNPTTRQSLYDEIQKLGTTEFPQIPLYYSPLIYGESDSVHGFAAYPLGNYHLEDVWLSK